MKNIYAVLLLSLNTLLFAQENYVQINGSTNINNFKCINSNFKSPTFGKPLPNIALKVADFDCKHKVMTADFQKTLSAENHPYLHVKFITFTKKQNEYNAQVEVKMMNKTKTYNVVFTIENGKLIGSKTVKFSDFNITPPKKMGGMITVKDNLHLTFRLNANLKN